jgi:hypothetical protein
MKYKRNWKVLRNSPILGAEIAKLKPVFVLYFSICFRFGELLLCPYGCIIVHSKEEEKSSRESEILHVKLEKHIQIHQISILANITEIIQPLKYKQIPKSFSPRTNPTYSLKL